MTSVSLTWLCWAPFTWWELSFARLQAQLSRPLSKDKPAISGAKVTWSREEDLKRDRELASSFHAKRAIFAPQLVRKEEGQVECAKLSAEVAQLKLKLEVAELKRLVDEAQA